MFAVVIPTRNSEATLVEVLAALVPAAADGIVREVIVADAGSTDATEAIADGAGCRWVVVSGGRGGQLAAGAAAAKRGTWLMFLEPDCILEAGWHHEVAGFVERAERSARADTVAGRFRYAVDELGWTARLKEWWACTRSIVFGIGYANQGLVLSRQLYDRLGGHRPLEVMADADFVRRLGRRRIVHLGVRAETRSVAREAERGFGAALRAALRPMLFWLRVPSPLIGRLCGTSR
ncbi:glycosyltransferase [Breoghania sp. L-A4]|uniref:glycosyltransferase n=1 Tax=Breoghania sp. L-A4 TaxID=2304600 RepID=UPI000E35FFD9|nr:glycosyltransferase [Breoghania sp. L-A4]AXS39529.1 glycosyltransferase [Breoghania sp. L-A4]